MKVTNLNIKNFLSIRSLVELDLDNKGLCLIQGENRDDTSASSNGAGKSTIGDSICWALYGTTARGESGDSVINNIEKKGCCVEVIIESDGKIYSIARYRKDKQHKNSVQVHNMTDITVLTKGTDRLTQEVINRLIGCSLEVFKSAIYAAQDSIPNLPGMTDKFLKQIVEEAAGIDRLSSAYEEARSRLKAGESKLMGAEGDLVRLKGNLNIREDRVEELKEKEKGFSINNDMKLKSLQAQISELITDGHKLVETVKVLNKPGIERDINLLGARLGDSVTEYQTATKAVSDASGAESIAALALKSIMKEARAKVADLKAINDKVGQPCGECGKAYQSSDIDDASDIAKKNLKVLKVEINSVKSSLDSAKKATQSASDELASLDDTSELIEKNKAAVAVLQSDLDRVDNLNNKIDTINKDVSRKQIECQETHDSESPYTDMIEAEAVEAEKLRDSIDLTEDRIKVLTKSVDLGKDAASVFGPGGVRAHILDTVTPQLNDRTSHYLSILSDGNISAVWNTLSKTKSGESREKFTIEVENDHGSSSFGGLSGGEKRKVRLATAMALQDLVSSRASKPINLWIADEIDDALDEAGLERLMTVLEEKAREKGTVLMISHNSLSDWIREQTTVIKEHHTVTVEGHLVT